MTKTTTPDTADSKGTLARYNLKSALIRNPTWISAGADISLEALSRIEALERALEEIIMEATSRNHAIDIARRARHGEGNT